MARPLPLLLVDPSVSADVTLDRLQRRIELLEATLTDCHRFTIHKMLGSTVREYLTHACERVGLLDPREIPTR